MVTNVDVLLEKEVIRSRHGLIMEIVGPAGSGKSSLFRALRKTAPDFLGGIQPPVWNILYTQFFVKNIFDLIPILARLHRTGDRPLTRRELAWMAMLNGWSGILEKTPKCDHNVLLFDQGPIFLMAVLYEFGPQSLLCTSAQAWWEKTFAKWMKALDVVIWLDAPDEVLINRIRERFKDHPMKEKPDAEVKEFLKKYREVYRYIMDILSSGNPRMQVLRFDTSKSTVNELVSTILSEFDPQNYRD